MFEVLTQFGIGFVIALSGALIPGPLLMFTVTHTMKNNKGYTGLLAGLGHCLVEAFIILAIILGLTQIFNLGTFQFLVNLVGGMALIVFGALSILEIEKKRRGHDDYGSGYNSLFGGIIFTLFNATIPLWWAGIGLAMLNNALKTTTMLGVLSWIFGHWTADLAWFGFVGYSIFKGKKVIGRRGHTLLILVCGLVLIALGIFFFTSSVLKGL